MNTNISNEALLTLAKNIAKSLPKEWQLNNDVIDRDCQSITIRADKDKAITLYPSYRQKGKLTIIGVKPTYGLTQQQIRNAYLNDRMPSINVSPNRHPQSIANDIVRRLLTDYEQARIKIEEAVIRYKETIEQIEQIEKALLSAMPKIHRYSDDTHGTSRRYTTYNNKDNSTFRSISINTSTYDYPHCDLDITTIDIPTTIRILTLLQSGISTEK